MVKAGNHRETSVTFASEAGYKFDPLLGFFIECYADAYTAELRSFVAVLSLDNISVPDGKDALRAIELTDAAFASALSGRTVVLER